MDSREQVRRRAHKAIRTAAEAHLAPLGVCRVGSGPRHWRDDHGWWLINIEFQPSGWDISTYLNVGLQYPWDGAEHGCFAYGSRRNVGNSQNASLDAQDSDEEVATATNAYAAAAARIVTAYRQELTPADRHFQAILAYIDKGQTWWNRAMVLVLLSRYSAARDLLTQIRHMQQESLDFYLQPVIGARGKPLSRPKNFEYGEELRQRDIALTDQIIAILEAHPDQARRWIESVIGVSRQKLRLPSDEFQLPELQQRLAPLADRSPLAELAKL